MKQHESSRKRLIICPQDKGGIGKSFVTTLIYDYLTDHKVKLKTFDLDHANSTFHRYVPESHFIDTDVDTDKLAVLDTMINALEGVDAVLVDNRASGGTKILQYIQESRIIELQSQLHFALVFVVIVLDDKDAISQIADLLDEYEARVRWLVVKNYRDSSQLSLFDQSQTRQRLEALGALEIAAPCLTEVTRNKLQFFNLTVAKGRSSDKLHLLDRTRCARFHDVMAAEFDKAKDFTHMDTPDELTRAPLPEDLRLLLHELKVPENDPILPLLGWLWTQINQTTNTIVDARMTFIAALDTRLEKMATSAELLGGVGQQMEQTRTAIDAIRTEIGQRIGAELKSPIDTSVTSCRSLATLLERLLHQTTEVLAHARRRQMIATLAAGFVTGMLTGLCLSSLGFLHQ